VKWTPSSISTFDSGLATTLSSLLRPLSLSRTLHTFWVLSRRPHRVRKFRLPTTRRQTEISAFTDVSHTTLLGWCTEEHYCSYTELSIGSGGRAVARVTSYTVGLNQQHKKALHATKCGKGDRINCRGGRRGLH
jgi:hypothetical protein